jgi:hypothetical protein
MHYMSVSTKTAFSSSGQPRGGTPPGTHVTQLQTTSIVSVRSRDHAVQQISSDRFTCNDTNNKQPILESCLLGFPYGSQRCANIAKLVTFTQGNARTEERWLFLLQYTKHVEECRLLGYETPVRTSQETHYVSATEPSRLMLYKI